MSLSIATTTRNNMLNQLAANFTAAGGTIVVYSGTRPANVQTALSGNTALVTFTLGASAFGSGSGGALTLAGTPINASATATGTASFVRAYDSSSNAVFDGDCGLGSTDFVLDSTSITAGQVIALNAGGVSMP